MKKRYIAAGVLAVMLSLTSAKAQQINPMTEAVIKGYSEILAENPKDYITLYDRASQYYNINNFDRALSDIDLALEYTPESDKNYRAAEYSLKADILLSKKDYQRALEASREALKINPSSAADYYRLGNINLLLNDGNEALKAFQQLQRINTRSQEAFYGMAKANIMLGKNDEAERLIKEIESFGKNSAITYCRIGDLQTDMGRTKDAVGNYVVAYMMGQDTQRPKESLTFLAKKDYPAVMQTLDAFVTASPDNLNYLFLKATIADSANDYETTEKACEQLLDKLDDDAPAVYRMLAMAQMAQNKLTPALANIKFAENLSKNNPYILADKADILLGIDPVQAMAVADEALAINPDLELAQLIGAKGAIMSNNAEKGLDYLNNIILTNPSNVEALLLRAYLNENVAKDSKAAVADYGRAGNAHVENNADLALAALGKSKAGKKLDAEGMISDAIAGAGSDKNTLFNIAVYYAQTGNLEKAKEFADKAKMAGYNNMYYLKGSNEPLISLSPIYHLM